MVQKSYRKKIIINFAVLFITLTFCLLIGEGVLRLMYDPVNFLEPEIVHDNIIGYRIKPFSGGHDVWGFRNKFVPGRADIITIGDSQTYGVNAPLSASWPKVLQKLRGIDVYNMAVPGFGPVDYYYVLIHEAVKLNPKLIIVGFYLGNDLLDAVNRVYKSEYWTFLRRPNFVDPRLRGTQGSGEGEDDEIILAGLRDWLARHSILYRVFIYTSARQLRYLEMKYLNRDDDIIIFEDVKHNIYTGFTPQRRLKGLDLDNPRVKEGLRITLNTFELMNEFCKNHNIPLVAVLMPTKEQVFTDWIAEGSPLTNSVTLMNLISKEKKANNIIKTHLEEKGILHIDVLDSLKSQIGRIEIYPRNEDGHPNKQGYEVIAKTVNEYLESNNIN